MDMPLCGRPRKPRPLRYCSRIAICIQQPLGLMLTGDNSSRCSVAIYLQPCCISKLLEALLRLAFLGQTQMAQIKRYLHQ
ncbi:hypothetical protein BO94DRAFT_76184 [Aspergillus sclerotioniger CBS 115572]|uniref:Uncharacterized protein n=1 Tax=Aspergillus sclerotioniger CBS 115572 TaxID=1450535 RepID=A0A317WLK5_9EURO|nr:hypothetical protein BO94DRAFT_76184 [Aspergillus sclerotioniger CBS 115572]PWY87354.1 hypothetical protein BO94DRAFT_76184 [Aspergillus sclerotioniger CBS 115572]